MLRSLRHYLRAQIKDIKPSIAWKREARKEEALDDRHSDEHWKCFKGNVGETSERRDGAYMGFSARTDTVLMAVISVVELIGRSRDEAKCRCMAQQEEDQEHLQSDVQPSVVTAGSTFSASLAMLLSGASEWAVKWTGYGACAPADRVAVCGLAVWSGAARSAAAGQSGCRAVSKPLGNGFHSTRDRP